MEKLNIGIIGTGGMAKIHTAAYMKNSNVQVYGACSITPSLAEEFANGKWGSVSYGEGEFKVEPLYQINKIYDSYKDMAQDPNINAVSIVVPNNLHYDIALEMIKNKKHVLVEKPLAINYQLAEKLVNAAREYGVLLATGHMWRYHQDVQYIKQVIDDGMLGEIYQTKAYGLHLQWGPGGWFTDKVQAGGGALIDMGVHAIDTTFYLLGDREVQSVSAAVRTCFGSYDVDDYAQILLKYKDGTVSLFESGWNYPYISGKEASVEIWGTKGYARVFPTCVNLKISNQWGKFIPEYIEAHNSIKPYFRQIDNFIGAILKRENCQVAYDVGMNVMRICDAAYLSATTDSVIKV